MRDEIAANLGPTRLVVEAHSGARINGVKGSIGEAENCFEHRSIHGEVPRVRPYIQCQAKVMAEHHCWMDNHAFLIPGVPAFWCRGDTVPDGGAAEMTQVSFDWGPRYDFMIMTGCYNDTGARDLHLGKADVCKPAKIIAKAAAQCDLANGLSDLRDYVPNAAVTVMSYYLTLSKFSLFENTEYPPVPGGALWWLLNV